MCKYIYNDTVNSKIVYIYYLPERQNDHKTQRDKKLSLKSRSVWSNIVENVFRIIIRRKNETTQAQLRCTERAKSENIKFL